MSELSKNQKRGRAIKFAHALRDTVFLPMVPSRAIWRLLFLGPDGNVLRRPGEIVLARLRRFCFADRSIFGGTAGPSDSTWLLGVREGRRQVWLEITKHLNLDEDAVQKLVENDDGY